MFSVKFLVVVIARLSPFFCFLKTSINAIKKARGEKELDAIEFLKLIKEKSAELKFDEKI